MFKKRRGIHIPYNRQGLIHFICVNYEDMPDKVREKIDRLCDEIGGEDAEALFEVLTNDTKPIYGIAAEFYVNEKKLYKMRKEFYETF